MYANEMSEFAYGIYNIVSRVEKKEEEENHRLTTLYMHPRVRRRFTVVTIEIVCPHKKQSIFKIYNYLLHF